MDDPRKRNLDLFFANKGALASHKRRLERELAERAALERMKARVAQTPCDVGLFSDSRNQIDLEDLLR